MSRKERSPGLRVIAVFIALFLFCFLFVDSPYFNGLSDYILQSRRADGTTDRIIVLDAGEADCILVQSNGRFALIDTGLAGDRRIIKSLKNYGVTGLDAVILTHWHDDHCGGFEELCRTFPVAHLVTPLPPDKTDDTVDLFQAVSDTAETNGIPVQTARVGMTMNVEQFELTVLLADASHADENNRSLVLMARCGSRKMLCMGDAEAPIEDLLIGEGYDLSCDVLKVGHHGSSSGTSDAFLDACSPTYALVSTGTGNSYGHPHKVVLTRLQQHNCNTYRTDYEGDLTVTFGERFSVTGSHDT